jgi:CRISPR/Cas system-associated exonuclease Cas4 (RecB family)
MNVKELFYKSIIDEFKATDIRVSVLAYDCLRHSYYEMVYDKPYSYQTAFRLWLGRSLHKTALTKGHETPVDYAGIRGTVDEYDEETGTLIEKKFVTTKLQDIPHNYINQIRYYGALLEKHGKKVNKMFLLVVNVTGEVTVYEVPKDESSFDELLRKANELKKALDTNTLPKRNIGVECTYCDFFSYCFSDDESNKRTKTVKDEVDKTAPN